MDSPVSPDSQNGIESPNNLASAHPPYPPQPPPPHRLISLPVNAPSPTTPPVFANSADTAFRRDVARTGLSRPSAQSSDYDSEEEMERLEDEQEVRFMEQQLGRGAAEAMRLQASDRGIRAHQLIRGQLPNKRVASKKAIASLESVDSSTLPESERSM